MASDARKSVRKWIVKAIPMAFMLGLLVYSILSVSVPAFYDQNQQIRAQAYAGKRVIFTTYFDWYQATGKVGPATHVVDVWTQANIDKLENATFMPGWPGPTNPMQMVIVRNGTMYHDALTFHPPAQQPTYYANGSVNASSLKTGIMENISSWFDWNNPAWHEWELRCMMRAGIDVLMPDDWYYETPGNASSDGEWSNQGLVQLVAAWHALPTKLVAEGLATTNARAQAMLPKICMFYDTTCQKTAYCANMSIQLNKSYDWCWNNLAGANLDDPYWRETFWLSIQAFFDRVDTAPLFTAPDGSNVVWLYGNGWFGDVGSSVLDYCKTQFHARYNRTLMFVGPQGWIKAGIDAICPWGACCPGPMLPVERGIPVGEVSPGFYGLGATTMGSTGYFPRTHARYEQAWQSVMGAGSVWVHVETWNELHEGTGISWTQEDGFHWIDLTRQMADTFHAIAGQASSVSINLVAFVIPLPILAALIALAFIKSRMHPAEQ